MKSIFLYAFLALIHFGTSQLWSQSKEEIEVKKTVVELFDAMRAGDSARASVLFHPNVRMFTSYQDSKGIEVLEEGALSDFLVAVGSPHPEIWDEKIWDTDVRIDGSLAQVWTNYAFYAGDRFSHCGVDAFHLIRGRDGQWRIVNLIDTRRKEPCRKF